MLCGAAVPQRLQQLSNTNNLLSILDKNGSLMTKLAVVTSQILLVLLFVAALAVQALILPGVAAQSRDLNPQVGYLYAPFLVMCIAVVACGQVVLASVWMLLRLVDRDRIFTKRAFVWVAIMIAALLLSTVLAAVMFVITNVILQLGGPPLLTLGLLAVMVGSTALALVLVALRGLLRKASDHAAYLEEVV